MLKKLLIIISIICSIFAVLIVILPFISDTNVDTQIKGSNDMQVNYTSTEEVADTNTWDISSDETSNVIAALSQEGILTISGTGTIEQWANNKNVPWYSIKEQIKEVNIQEGITNIGAFAFYECSNLTDITISEGIITIEKSAFFGCSSLKEISIPETVTSIGDYAFGQCSSLKEITIPSKVTTIDHGLFSNCSNLIKITLPEGITTINEYVFTECDSLTNVFIPKGVTSITTTAFEECNNLINIKVDENNTRYCDQNGVLYAKDKKKIVRYPSGREDSTYTILDSVTAIEPEAFYGNDKLQELTIPESVTKIGSIAFSGCSNLTKVIIPRTVTSIGYYAFSICDNLKIICYEGSVAETYAQENEILYELIYISSTVQTIDKENSMIRKIEPKTMVQEIRTSIQCNVPYEIINKSGEVLGDTEIIGTGYTLKMCTGETYKIIVWGDLNGDGEIKISELARASRIGISEEQISETEMLVMDVSMDENIKINDLAAISRLARE